MSDEHQEDEIREDDVEKDDVEEDDVLDLTEDMTSMAEPHDLRASTPAPPASPFTLLVAPRGEKERRESRTSYTPEKKSDSNSVFVPMGSSDAVVTSTIRTLGEEEDEPDDGESIEAEGTNEVLELGQEMVVADESEPEEKPEEEEPEEEEPEEEKSEEDPEEKPEEEKPAEESEEEPIDLGEDHIVEEGGEAAAGTDEQEDGAQVAHPFDFGTPEMVFDSAGVDEGQEGEEEEEFEELGEDELEEESDEAEGGESIDVEIDLTDAEDLTDLTPMSETFLKKAATGVQGAKPRKRRKRRKLKKEWWKQIFDDDYMLLLPKYAKRDTRREVDFIKSNLDLPPEGLVLDLACGAGRHAVAMAKKNYRVVGVDLSLSMLALAGDQAQEAGQKINLIHGDMRDLGFDSTFDGIYCLGTSFGYFDEATNLKVLDGVYKALKPGAQFLLEIANRDFVTTKQPNLMWFEMENVISMEETDFNYISSRLVVTRQLIINGGERQAKHEISLRLYSLHEIGQLLHSVGFAVKKVSGHYATPGAFFGPDSSQIIIVAERRK